MGSEVFLEVNRLYISSTKYINNTVTPENSSSISRPDQQFNELDDINHSRVSCIDSIFLLMPIEEYMKLKWDIAG